MPPDTKARRDASQSQVRLIFSAVKQARKVRLILYLSLVCLFIATYAAYVLFTTFGTNPADGTGGQLAPFPERLAWGLSTLALGISFFGGMLIYCALYAVEVGYLREDQTYRVSLLSLAGARQLRFRLTDITSIRHHRGRLDTGGVAVNAPWTMLRLTGRRLPILIDQQGDRLDRREFNRLVRSKP